MKKLKQQYQNFAKHKKIDYVWNVYPNVRSGTHKNFSDYHRTSASLSRR
nr:Putative uncharacterized protein [Moritella viscosa]